jgi:hypothetical protein
MPINAKEIKSAVLSRCNGNCQQQHSAAQADGT